MSDLYVALVSGSIGIVGVIGGIWLTALTTKGAESRRLASEDQRRWQSERRSMYSAYLGYAEVLLRKVENVGVFLTYDEPGGLDLETEEIVQQGLLEYFEEWENTLQPALGEVQLLASPEVAELADRVSGALMECSGPIEQRSSFTEYCPTWFQTRDLINVLRNAMRAELGLTGMLDQVARSREWPWLPERPARDTYIQSHPGTKPSPDENS